MAKILILSIFVLVTVILVSTIPIGHSKLVIIVSNLTVESTTVASLNETKNTNETIDESWNSYNQTLTEDPDLTVECVLRKYLDDGFIQVNKSRAEVGADAYPDYEEYCLLPFDIRVLSPGALASLAG